jgi:type I restriction enzyme S subunit
MRKGSESETAEPGMLNRGMTRIWLGLVRDRGIITSAYLCFRTTGTLSPEYGYHLLHAFDLMKIFYGLGSGLRQNLDWGDFKRMVIFIPPPEEQAAIVRFIDYANGRLDRAIQAKRKVIALLHEQKQAIVHRAVTRGLDPTVPLKPSGIPWLGDIPKHWEVLRAGNLFYEVVDTGHPNALLLSIDRFKGVIPQSDTGRRTRASEDRSAYKRVLPGQLAYNLMNAFMGALGFSIHDGIVSPAYAVAQPRRKIEPLYFHHLLRTTAYTAEFIHTYCLRRSTPQVRHGSLESCRRS